MKAVVWNGVGNITLDEVADPVMISPTDAIIRVTATSICGTDLHLVRGTLAGMKKGTILGHEALGIVEEIGNDVRVVKPGDRVLVLSTIACGECIYCKAEEFSSCDKSNPKGAESGTCFFGGPETTGPINGLQAERARIPFADTTLVKLPEEIRDEDALLVSDIFPTGFMGAEIADVKEGDIVAVFGCGPVGQMAIASCFLKGAAKVLAVDCLEDRLEMAEKQGAVPINYEVVDPIQVLKNESNGYGPDSCIDAVGIDAQRPHTGPAKSSFGEAAQAALEKKMAAPVSVMFGDHWRQGDGPMQVLKWCVEAVRKSGVISIIGVYNEMSMFPIGLAMEKNITVRAANCSHRKYAPMLLDLIMKGEFMPSQILTKVSSFNDAIVCYEAFDKREPDWIKVELLPDQRKAA